MAKHREWGRGWNGKIKTSSLSLFAWVPTAGKERREKPVGVDGHSIPLGKAIPEIGMAFLHLAMYAGSFVWL